MKQFEVLFLFRPTFLPGMPNAFLAVFRRLAFWQTDALASGGIAAVAAIKNSYAAATAAEWRRIRIFSGFVILGGLHVFSYYI